MTQQEKIVANQFIDSILLESFIDEIRNKIIEVLSREIPTEYFWFVK